jgi:hypothetical protein
MAAAEQADAPLPALPQIKRLRICLLGGTDD